MYRPDGNGGVTAQLSERSFLDEVRGELGITGLRVVTTGGDESAPLSTSDDVDGYGGIAVGSAIWGRCRLYTGMPSKSAGPG